MEIVLQNLTADRFKPYGQIIECQSELSDDFQIILKEEDAWGWQIAISKLSKKSISKLGMHPNTRESFEPLSGVSFIVVAVEDHPSKLEAFLLDKPICLFKNIWHATATLTKTSLIKITENCGVESKEYILEHPLRIGLIDGLVDK